MNHSEILNNCLDLFKKVLLDGVESSVKHVLQDIFNQAENASSNAQEQLLFENYKLLKLYYPQMMQSMEQTTAVMPEFISEQISRSDKKISLSLVEDEELEISLSLTQLEAQLDNRFHAELHALEKRLRVLYASRNMDRNNMPFSPESISWILSRVLETIELDVSVKASLIDKMTRVLSEDMRAVYVRMNDLFIEAGILPNIRPEAKARAESAAAARRAPAAESGAPAEDGTSNYNYEQQSKQLINSIFELLSSRGGTTAGPSEQSISEAVETSDLEVAMSALSKERKFEANSQSMSAIKAELIEQVAQHSGLLSPQLSQAQAKSLDVMGMVYDQIKQDESIDDHIQSSINSINLPLLRMAMTDRSFFESNSHPARQYLEMMIYAAQQWHGSSVVKKLSKFSDRIAQSFDGSKQAFTEATEALRSYLDTTEKRARKAEEKWVSAAQGREKLELARESVHDMISEWLQDNKIRFVETVLTQVWEDAMVLTLLRHGKHSEKWHRRVRAAETLAHMGSPDKVNALSGKKKIESLHALDTTMDELGYSKRDREKVINNLKVCTEWSSAEPEERADTPQIERVMSLEESASKKEAETERKNKRIEDIRELNDKEKSILAKLRILPYGTVFDFFINQQRDKIRRKLSWLSPISNKALFLDQFGKQPHEVTLQRVAIDIARGNVVQVEVESGGYFEKALNRIVKSLKSLV